METNNYLLSTLPSYVKYSRREIGKLSKEDRRETAFTGIRQKLSSAVISVPYGGGLDNLRLIGNLEDHEFQNRFTSYRKPRRRIKNHVSDSEMLFSDREMSPKRYHSHHHHDHAPQVPQARSVFGIKPKRIGSETSTTSTATTKSRSTIYSTGSEFDDGFWSKKLKELDEVKERYSNNSEFLNHLHGHKIQHDKKTKKKKKRQKDMERKRDDETTPNSVVEDISNRLVLPPIYHKHEVKSRESTLTNISDESNTSTLVADENNDEDEHLKKRKVEFNFHRAKRSLKLPPIPSAEPGHGHPPKSQTKAPKRSILKRLSKKNTDVVNSFPANSTNPPPSIWETDMGKLKSPVPAPANRRHQVTFKRNPFNLKYKCSKEFEVVATNYEGEGKSPASFVTEGEGKSPASFITDSR